MALLDKGGAELHRQRWKPDWDAGIGLDEFAPPIPDPMKRPPKATIRVNVVETHDGHPCDCIPAEASEIVMHVGDTLELTHTCNDGRVDKIIATIVSVETPPAVEHGKATVERASS